MLVTTTILYLGRPCTFVAPSIAPPTRVPRRRDTEGLSSHCPTIPALPRVFSPRAHKLRSGGYIIPGAFEKHPLTLLPSGVGQGTGDRGQATSSSQWNLPRDFHGLPIGVGNHGPSSLQGKQIPIVKARIISFKHQMSPTRFRSRSTPAPAWNPSIFDRPRTRLFAEMFVAMSW